MTPALLPEGGGAGVWFCVALIRAPVTDYAALFFWARMPRVLI